MATQYEVKGFLKHFEEDSFSEGCLPHTGGMTSDSTLHWAAADIPGLIEQLRVFTGADKEGVLLDSCGEAGRVDCLLLEDAEGTPASQSQVDRWKQGDLKLYAVTYSFNIERVTRETVSLKGV